MFDGYLGQAGFGEQIGLYETFWRQVGSALLWAFLVTWAVLLFVAIIVMVARRSERAAPSRAGRAADGHAHGWHVGSARIVHLRLRPRHPHRVA